MTVMWRDQGVAGITRLWADLAMRLPLEYFSTSAGRLKELTMTSDLFEGTWRANIDKSQWDPRYTPEQARITLEATATGYLMVAYGIKDGQAVAERPAPIIADGRRRPIVDLNGRPIAGVPPGAMAFGSRPDPQTIEGGAEVDGKTLGKRTYRVSEDGKTLTVTVEGMGIKRPFKTVAVFDRVEPDPYVPFGWTSDSGRSSAAAARSRRASCERHAEKRVLRSGWRRASPLGSYWQPRSPTRSTIRTSWPHFWSRQSCWP